VKVTVNSVHGSACTTSAHDIFSVVITANNGDTFEIWERVEDGKVRLSCNDRHRLVISLVAGNIVSIREEK
jgi:uncharacterized repeat protein (TIGR04076 family)